MSKLFTITLYTLQQLSDVNTLEVLWGLVNDPIVNPQKYDSVERAKKPFREDAIEDARELYETNGMLFIKGGKDGCLMFFEQQSEKLSTWTIYLNIALLGEKKLIAWLNWLFTLCSKLPILYGFGCSHLEYEAKHAYERQLDTGGSISGAVGVSIAEFHQYLPGLYWLTIFGPELVEAFGKSKLMSLPGVKASELEANQIALRLDEPVVTEDMEQRLQRQQQLADLLGSQFFFDRHRTTTEFKLVPQLAHALGVTPPLMKEGDLDESAAFENQVILAPDGVPYESLKALAEQLVALLHMDVQDIFSYSRSALASLDTYFHAHPQAEIYTTEHLDAELIPALGAYLGEILIREQNGTWAQRDPLLKSSVVFDKKEVFPFRLAYQAIHQRMQLADLYSSVVKHAKT